MSAQDLWCEVLRAAIADAVSGISDKGTPEVRARLTQKARDYITKPNRDFNTVCHLAGVDPVATRQRVAAQIAKAPSPEELAQAGQRNANSKKSLQRFTDAQGRTLSISEWAKETGIPKSVLSTRLSQLGWPLERAITQPVRPLQSRLEITR